MSPTYVLGLVFAIIILVMVFVKMRNSGLKERYGLWWYCIAFFTALLSIFPPILKWSAMQLGVVVPLNLGFFVAGVVLLLLSLRFSVDLSRSDEDRRRLLRRLRFCASRWRICRAALTLLRRRARGMVSPADARSLSARNQLNEAGARQVET